MKHVIQFIGQVSIFLSGFGALYAQKSAVTPAWAATYDKVRPSEDVFIVEKSGKMGVVNVLGKRLNRMAYDTIYNFSEGMAIVGLGHREVNEFGKVLSDFKYGYINKAGRLVIPIKYELVDDFSEGVGLVIPSSHKVVWFDKEGKPALSINTKQPESAFGNMYEADDFKGNMAYVTVTGKGFWLAPYPDRNNGTHTQLYDVDGKTIYGNYIDHEGRLLVPWKYDSIAPYYPGYLRAVRKEGKWGFLDSLARVKVPLVYDDIDADSAFFWQNRQRVGQSGRFGFMDTHTGKLLIPLQFENSLPSQTSLVWVSKNGRWGVIDSSGSVTIPFQYAGATPFDAHSLAVVKKNGKWGLVNESGKVLTPFQYDNIVSFQGDRAVVEREGKFGFIDLTGQEIIPARFDKVSQFVDGQAFASYRGLFITLDGDGNWVTTKLQTSTLKGLSILIVCLVVGAWLWLQHRKNRLQNVIS